MLYAFNCMKWGRCNNNRGFRFNSRLYERLKMNYSQLRIKLMNTNNPMTNKIWIYNEELETSKIWDADEELPRGWKRGRHYKSWFVKKKIEEQLKNEKMTLNYEQRKKRISEINVMYGEFVEYGFEYIQRKYGYTKTRNNLLILFKKYVPNYKPTLCNRWKNRK